VVEVDECGDFVTANELLKKQIGKQYDGKTCTKTFPGWLSRHSETFLSRREYAPLIHGS